MTAGTIAPLSLRYEASLSSAPPSASSRRPVRRGTPRSSLGRRGPGSLGDRAELVGQHRNVPGAPISLLVGVTCVSASDCWAVGDRFRSSSSNAGPALIEHYADGAWTTTAAAPAESGTLDELAGVSCLSATDCWAVGMRSGSHSGNLVEHFGAHGGWTVVNTPEPQGELSAVTCEPANGECWAVGSSDNGRLASTFRLLGGSWRYVRPAPLSASFVQASGVACAAQTTACSSGTPRRNTVPAGPWPSGGMGVPGPRSQSRACSRGVVPWPASTVCRGVLPSPAGRSARPSERLGPGRDPSPRRALGRELVRLRPQSLGKPGDYPELRAVS